MTSASRQIRVFRHPAFLGDHARRTDLSRERWCQGERGKVLAEDVIRDRYHVCQTEPEAVKALFGKPEVRYAAG